MKLSLSRLNHRLPRGQAHPDVVQGTAGIPHPSAAAHLPEAASVFDAATALDTATDMVDPQPTLVDLLVRHGLLPRAPAVNRDKLSNKILPYPLDQCLMSWTGLIPPIQ
jgi:hypothetical protein